MESAIPLHPYAELHGGLITGSSDPSKIGRVWYFIDYVDGEGRCFGMWDGSSYEAACDELAEWRRDGVRTVDLLRKAH